MTTNIEARNDYRRVLDIPLDAPLWGDDATREFHAKWLSHHEVQDMLNFDSRVRTLHMVVLDAIETNNKKNLYKIQDWVARTIEHGSNTGSKFYRSTALFSEKAKAALVTDGISIHKLGGKGKAGKVKYGYSSHFGFTNEHILSRMYLAIWIFASARKMLKAFEDDMPRVEAALQQLILDVLSISLRMFITQDEVARVLTELPKGFRPFIDNPMVRINSPKSGESIKSVLNAEYYA